MERKEKNSSAASAGVGFSGLLTIAFIILKLVKVINWPWIWVLSPLWIEAAIILIITVVVWFFINH